MKVGNDDCILINLIIILGVPVGLEITAVYVVANVFDDVATHVCRLHNSQENIRKID